MDKDDWNLNQRMAFGLDTEREIEKYDLDTSTFDLVNVDEFHHLGFGVILDYLLFTWLFFILHWTLLGVDIYTCLNILVFHHWSTSDYKPYAYLVAKWIFTGCIIFGLCLRAYQWIRAIKTYRTRNIALSYVNFWTKLMYLMKRYNYHCLFYSIKQDNFFDLCAFYAYTELDNILSLCVADAPRQVINILTLRYYATDGDYSLSFLQIGSNIAKIATTNLKLAIILLFMCVSLVIFAIFFFKFLGGMLCYVPVVFGLRKRGYRSLKKYCCEMVNLRVRLLVRKHHKLKQTLLDEGVLDLEEIKHHPLLNLSGTFTESVPDDSFQYRGMSSYGVQLEARSRFDGGGEPKKPSKVFTYELLPLSDMNHKDPFSDLNMVLSNPGMSRIAPPPATHRENTFPESNQKNPNPFQENPFVGYSAPSYKLRNGSASSLTHATVDNLATGGLPTYREYTPGLGDEFSSKDNLMFSQEREIRGYSGLESRTGTGNLSESGNRSASGNTVSEYQPYRPQYTQEEDMGDYASKSGDTHNTSQDTGLLGDYYDIDPQSAAPPYPLRESMVIRKYAASEIYPDEGEEEEEDEEERRRMRRRGGEEGKVRNGQRTV